MKIEVMDRIDAIKASKTLDEPTLIISIHVPQESAARFYESEFLVHVVPLAFDDYDKEVSWYQVMTDDQAKEVADAVVKYAPWVSRIIVHCDAGVSRSAGVAAAIMKYLTGDDMPIFESPKYCPNMLCYRKVLEALMMPPTEEELEAKEKVSEAATYERLYYEQDD